MKKTLMIDGMTCGHCVAHVEKALKGVNGVSSVKVDLKKKQASVEGDGLDDAAMRAAVDEAGYSVGLISQG